MLKKKLGYLTPITKFSEVLPEGLICESTTENLGGSGFDIPGADIDDHSGDDDWGW